uniref:SCAN box domain-containing protein n=1 Tax=Oryzias latipes TaxID=8090 RepID=A0A3P9I2C7_ORYLA
MQKYIIPKSYCLTMDPTNLQRQTGVKCLCPAGLPLPEASGSVDQRSRRHNSPVTCCRRLRSAEVPSGRRPAGACCRLKGLCRGWDRPERRTEELIGGVAVVEQPQPVHPSDARTWVEEHVPGDSPADACRPTGQDAFPSVRISWIYVDCLNC